jgi:hypothetical protein
MVIESGLQVRSKYSDALYALYRPKGNAFTIDRKIPVRWHNETIVRGYAKQKKLQQHLF